MAYLALLRTIRRCKNGTRPFHVISSLSKINERNSRNYASKSYVDSLIQAQTGIFRSISESAPVEYLQAFVVNLHDATGLPWWATIVATTIFLRSSVTVPLAVYQHYIMGKVHNVQLELGEIAKELKIEVAVAAKMYKWDQKDANYHFKRSLKKHWNALVVRENCHPVKGSLLIWFQIPVWICFSVTLRNLVYMLPDTNLNATIIYNQLTTDGFGWMQNLTHADPFFILPILLGVINLSIVELQALSVTQPPSKFRRYVLNLFRGFSVFMIPVAACVPSCLALYWTTSSFYGLIQNLALMSPKIRRSCRIPQTSYELERPYSHIIGWVKIKANSVSGMCRNDRK